MVLVAIESEARVAQPGLEPFPHEVEFVISALEAGPRPLVERQREKRTPYRVRATLKLYSDPKGSPPYLIYTRHVNSRAIGFLTNRPLTLSHGGMLCLPGPDGRNLDVACTVLRCREASPGWFEGAVYFNREQPVFLADRLAQVQGLQTDAEDEQER